MGCMWGKDRQASVGLGEWGGMMGHPGVQKEPVCTMSWGITGGG